MCLYYAKIVGTSEDIICYKRLEPIFYANKDFKHGDSFVAQISAYEVSGKISIHQGKAYFCSNSYTANGKVIPDTLGFQYSWELDRDVTNVFINGEFLSLNINYITPYRKFPVIIGETYTSEIELNKYNIVHEAIHSFKEIEGAFLDCKYDDSIIVKCLIPKGSSCYLGSFHSPNDSYACDKLTYLEIIKPHSMSLNQFKQTLIK